MAKPETPTGPVPPGRRAAETPGDRARALAAATARLAARRARDVLPVRIETRRLVLRAPIRGDVPELVRLADNPAVAARLSRLPSPYTRADAIGFVEVMAQRPDERPYAIILKDMLAGIIGFSFRPGYPPELGYWLGEPHWGNGLMSEAARALVDAAHASGHFRLIMARALADNAASLRVLEKTGFRVVRQGLEESGAHAGRPVTYLELEQPRWT